MCERGRRRRAVDPVHIHCPLVTVLEIVDVVVGGERE